jgi:hypothetical protein
MTSQAKVAASRANARASTGPKTADGRRRSACNALQHGLSRPFYSDPACSERVAKLAGEIAGPNSNFETQQLAFRVAEAQIDLWRARHMRHQLLSQALGDLSYSGSSYSRMPEVETNVAVPCSRGTDPLLERIDQLMRLDRYERRALLRCKIATRAFDEARQRGTNSV